MTRIAVIPEKELSDFIAIVDNAYPGMEISSKEEKEKFNQELIKIQKVPTFHIYGAYRKGTMVGGMILHDFTMNVFSVKTVVGGVGMVAVDLGHKKEKVCKDMITFFLEHYKKKKSFLTSLYPFRPDFYRNMGFGLGTKMHQYRLPPNQLPNYTKDHIQFLDKTDKKALLACYARYMEKTHGMIEKIELQLDRVLDSPQSKIVGYKKGDTILGYIIFKFEKGSTKSFIINDIIISEFVYETKEALLELLTFLHRQKDQIRHIVINTQDDYFHHLCADPRNDSDHLIPSVYHECHLSGVGLMYRVIDTKQLFTVLKNHNFGGQDLTMKLCIKDSFFPENEGETIIHFKKGNPVVTQSGYEVTVGLDVADFSSLVMGVVPFDRLYQYGLADISDPEYVGKVTETFRVKEKPVCMTAF